MVLRLNLDGDFLVPSDELVNPLHLILAFELLHELVDITVL